MSGERKVKVLYDEKAIASRTEALAGQIAAAEPKDLLVVAILKGSFMFAADLLRALHRVGSGTPGRVLPSLQLSRRHGLDRNRAHPPGHRIFGARP